MDRTGFGLAAWGGDASGARAVGGRRVVRVGDFLPAAVFGAGSEGEFDGVLRRRVAPDRAVAGRAVAVFRVGDFMRPGGWAASFARQTIGSGLPAAQRKIPARLPAPGDAPG